MTTPSASHTENDLKSAKPADDVDALREKVLSLNDEIQHLKSRVAWFENQMFGRKSEKRLIENPHQQSLLGEPVETPAADEPKIEITYQRGTAKKQRGDDCVTDTGLRFSDDVPVEVIRVEPPELQGADADQYEIIDTKITHKLAQQPSSYVVLRYELPVIKMKNTDAIKTTAMPPQVLDSCMADVSVLVGLMIDKFQYHLPLYRQHQRMQQAGFTVSRASLTNWVKRSIELLRPIVEAQLVHVLQSSVLAMDETPIKASREQKGKMKQGWFWPVYGEDDEVVFTYSDSRGRQQVEKLLKEQFKGVLITDGYAAYARFVKKTEGITHAQCWVHSRRKFVEAHDQVSLDIIGRLYAVEDEIRLQKLFGEKKRDYRLAYSKPVVDAFFAWCNEQCQREDLTPKDPLTLALNYVRNREAELRVFLEDPDVPLDTNHLEREIRPIPLGRKNWLFCWTELGAEHVGLIQSLISTCKLHDIQPYAYLIDVLQRISVHPASKVEDLTPRVWKILFAGNPLRSPLHKEFKYVVE
jgi:transposase